ncbi:MAG: energy transducer TonB [Vicinamibacterales bacterium]
MAESTSSGGPSALVSGHLSVRADGPVPHEFNFLVGQQSRRLIPAVLTSFGIEVLVVLLLVFAGRWATKETTAPFLPDLDNTHLVFLPSPGVGGGGGGGGNKTPEPPKAAKLPGKAAVSVPVVKPPAPAPQETKKEPDPPPIQQINIPVKALGSADSVLPGAIEAPAAPSLVSLGSGSGSGAGTGRGSGLGQGTGSGLGAGSGGGTGGGVYRPGNGVSTPRVLYQEKVTYTSDAMRAKVQGSVLLQCTVTTDGKVTDVRVVRSLDPVFGLDQEAIRAARLWRFAPGTRMGEPVPVEITIELTFSLR